MKVEARPPASCLLRPCSPSCPNSRAPSHIVAPYGPTTSPYLFIGERPGIREHWKGIPFVGDTGEEFDGLYLPTAGLDRRYVRVSNAVKCYRDGKNPEDWEVQACAWRHLPAEINQMPELELIVLMGAAAAKTVSTPRWPHGVDIEMMHGRPLAVEDYLGTGPRQLFFTYHPTLGMRSVDMMAEVLGDFEALGRWLSGELEEVVDEYPLAVYELIRDPRRVRELERNLSSLPPSSPIAMDTETEEDGSMYCGSLAFQPGAGYMFLREDPEVISSINRMIAGRELWFQNWLFDAPVCESGGLSIHPFQIRDTMLHPFHRQLSQGLKVQAFRRCGMEMEEYQDVVRPYEEAALYDYLERAALGVEKAAEWRTALTWLGMLSRDSGLALHPASPLPPLEQYTNKNGEARNRRGIAPWKKLAGILSRWEKFEGSDMLRSWEGLDEGVRELAEAVAGARPAVSLRAVPMTKQIRYAARDADACLRVGMSYRGSGGEWEGPKRGS